MTAEQIQEEEKSKGQDCGAFILYQQDVPWVSGQDLNIDYSGDAPLVTTSLAARPDSSSKSQIGAPRFSVEYYLRGFGGASFINGNTPASAGFDGGVLFPLGNRLLVGPTAGFQWVNSSAVRSIGSMNPGSTFAKTSAGFKEGNFGGQLSFPLSGFQLGIRGGATVAGSTITQATGFCSAGNATNPVGGCTTTSSTTTHDTVVGPFVGGYISHSICPHIGVFVDYDYTRLKDTAASGTSGSSSSSSGTVFDLHSNSITAGVVLSFGRHKPK
jgi:hypothetical protein